MSHETAAWLATAWLPEFARSYPDVVVELALDDALTDIVSGGYDAGIRQGRLVDKDMISVRVSAASHVAVVAAPTYFERLSRPQSPRDLGAHRLLVYRFASSGALHRWEFSKGGKKRSVAVRPAFVANGADVLLRAALGGVGITCLLEETVEGHLASGALVRVLSVFAALGSDPERIVLRRPEDLARLSPGEARKLALAIGLGRHAWALVLDEPTNHLDLPTVERLEGALASYPGAIVLVTHDDAFASRCTTRTLRVEGGTVTLADFATPSFMAAGIPTLELGAGGIATPSSALVVTADNLVFSAD